MTDDDRMTLAIKKKFPGAVEILARAPVLHVGWEMDNEVCVVRFNDGSRKLVTTNHGGLYIAERKVFEDKIAEYRNAIEASIRLLSVLDGSD